MADGHDNAIDRGARYLDQLSGRVRALDVDALAGRAQRLMAKAEDLLAQAAAIEGTVVEPSASSPEPAVSRTPSRPADSPWLRLCVLIAATLAGAWLLGRERS